MEINANLNWIELNWIVEKWPYYSFITRINFSRQAPTQSLPIIDQHVILSTIQCLPYSTSSEPILIDRERYPTMEVRGKQSGPPISSVDPHEIDVIHAFLHQFKSQFFEPRMRSTTCRLVQQKNHKGVRQEIETDVTKLTKSHKTVSAQHKICLTLLM